MKNPSMKALLMTAAMTGLLTGVTPVLQASTRTNTPEGKTSVSRANAGARVLLAGDSDKDKHACKGQNSCKGKGGCKSSDNGCKGKNSCKGKGGCATDGSKPPEFA